MVYRMYRLVSCRRKGRSVQISGRSIQKNRYSFKYTLVHANSNFLFISFLIVFLKLFSKSFFHKSILTAEILEKFRKYD